MLLTLNLAFNTGRVKVGDTIDVVGMRVGKDNKI